MTTAPPRPPYPPSVGSSEPNDPPLYTQTPITKAQADTATVQAAAMDDAARRFWAPAERIATRWWQATGPDAHLTDEPVLPPVIGWELPTSPDDATHRVADRIALLLSETEQQRHQRLQAERDAAYALHGETQRQRTERHKREAHARQTAARRRQIRGEMLNSSLRARRFRRWCTLTALSAAIGWQCGLVQILGTVAADSDPVLHAGAGLFFLGIGGAIDWYLRGGARDGGAIPVTEIRGKARLLLLIVTRVPFASALAAALQISPLFAATGRLFH